jgi:hypothetical protein
MKPLHQRKHDRITWGGSPSRDTIAADHAVAPFDRVSREMEATWGIDRLATLVSPDTAAKFGRTLGSLNAALDANDPERVADRAAACIRGLQAMDREARTLGHVPPSSGVIVHELDGWKFGLLPDHALWRQAEAEHSGLPIYTLREIGVLLQAAEGNHPLLAATREAFPGSEVVAVRKQRRGPVPDDEIPLPAPDDELPF